MQLVDADALEHLLLPSGDEPLLLLGDVLLGWSEVNLAQLVQQLLLLLSEIGEGMLLLTYQFLCCHDYELLLDHRVIVLQFSHAGLPSSLLVLLEHLGVASIIVLHSDALVQIVVLLLLE